MPQFLWSDKCVEANSLPEALLQVQGNGKSSTKSRNLSIDIGSLPFRQCQCLGPMSPRSRDRWSCWLKAMFGSLALVVFCLFLRRLYCDWTDGGASYRHYEEKFRNGVSNDTLSDFLYQLTLEPHVAGTQQNFDTAKYVHDRFVEYGISARYTDYEVLLDYPVSRSLYLTGVSESEGSFKLMEEVVDDDPYTKNPNIMPTFHGYSPSGNVSGPVVYANYGSDEDFEYLCKLKVNITGSVVLARYGEIYRGDIVTNAERFGAIGVVIYSDPSDYARNDTQGSYPDSEWLPSTGVQRGTVRANVGDPLTPGWPSTAGNEKLNPSDVTDFPGIPSLPISGSDALRILRGLDGPVAPLHWRGGFDKECYRISRGPAKLNLTYVASKELRVIRNVIGVIDGSEEPDRYVVLGNHRDAWIFGAVDPGSGTASLLELARGFGNLLRQGWKPRRSIILGSWDAEEYGMIGSTEWVEENLGMLGARAVAYINVDCAVAGPGFFASATPQLDSVLQEITQQVTDPDGNYATVFDAWQAATQTSTGAPEISRLGKGDSDFVAFLQHAGIPSLDLHFGEDYPVYHSVYDNYNWMVKFGDPKFRRHVALTQIWGMLSLRLADEAVLPFDFLIYARELQEYVKDVVNYLEEVKAPSDVDVTPLHSAVTGLLRAAATIRQESNMFKAFRPDAQDLFYFLLRRRALNDRLMFAERSFLDQDGLPGPGRSWYKHLVYGPTSSNAYSTTNFPGILDKITTARTARLTNSVMNWNALQHEVWRATRAVNKVSAILHGTIT